MPQSVGPSDLCLNGWNADRGLTTAAITFRTSGPVARSQSGSLERCQEPLFKVPDTFVLPVVKPQGFDGEPGDFRELADGEHARLSNAAGLMCGKTKSEIRMSKSETHAVAELNPKYESKFQAKGPFRRIHSNFEICASDFDIRISDFVPKFERLHVKVSCNGRVNQKNRRNFKIADLPKRGVACGL